MSASATAYLNCDECGENIVVELEGPDVRGGQGSASIAEAVDAEGWSWHGPLLDRLLCEICAETEES